MPAESVEGLCQKARQAVEQRNPDREHRMHGRAAEGADRNRLSAGIESTVQIAAPRLGPYCHLSPDGRRGATANFDSEPKTQPPRAEAQARRT